MPMNHYERREPNGTPLPDGELPRHECPRCRGGGTILRNSRSIEFGRSYDAKCPRCDGSGAIPYRWKELRVLAADAVRSEIRKYGHLRPETYDADSAWCVLHEIAQSDPHSLAARFYRHAPEQHVNLWLREWRQAAKRARG